MKTAIRFLTMTAMCCLLAAAAMFTPAKVRAAGPNPVVIMQTSMGNIFIMLYPDKAPKTVANFLKYVNAGFYDETIFHRVIKQKKPSAQDKVDEDNTMNVIQGGGYIYPMQRKRPLAPPIPNESLTGLENNKGTIAMARGNDPNSATSQFFINTENNPVLNYHSQVKQTGALSYKSAVSSGYCAFGKVIRGMDVVEKIHQVQTGSAAGMKDVPVKPVYIKKCWVAK